MPPLNQLRAFEAAARHLSFKDAAEELNVTHSAISHQVRALEEFLDSQLFQRTPRGVQLTAEAKTLSLDLTKAFNGMNFAVNRFKADDMTGTLRISVVPWYGNKYLVPHLPEFRAAHPRLGIEMEFSYECVDFEKENFHAALRHGIGDWENLTAYRVSNDYVSPICVPEMITGKTLPLSPEEISQLVLAVAQGCEDDWNTWLAEAGLTKDCKPKFKFFDNQALAVEFALAGNGVALSNLPSRLEDIQSGKCVQLHPLAINLERGLHLVFPETPYPDPRLRVVAEWIKDVLPVPQES